MGEMYEVRAGDNLWNIARAKLGSGAQWPRLWRYNNRRDVIARTGRGIPDPDLIHPGQKLLLPVLPGAGVSPPPATPAPRPAPTPPPPPPRMDGGRAQPQRTAPDRDTDGGRLSDRLPHVQSPISFKYKLDDLKFPPMEAPDFTLEMKLTGDVVLMSRKAVPAVYVTNRQEIELQMTSQANSALNSLFTDTRLVFDDKEKKLTYRSMLVTQSSTPGVPTTAVGVEASSDGKIKLRFEIRLPKLEGSIPDFLYVAHGVVVVVELTPHPRPPGSGPVAQPLRRPVPVPVAEPGTDWNRVIGTGLKVAAVAVVVGTVVEDFLTLGAGTADDVPSFAAAASLFARGRAMMQSAAVVLPRAVVPATISLRALVLSPTAGPALVPVLAR